MNSQVVSISQALKSYQTFYGVISFIAVSLFLSAGFVSVSVIWFFAICFYNPINPSELKWNRLYPLLWPIALYGLGLIWIAFLTDKEAAFELMLRRTHMLLIPLGFVLINKVVSDRALHFILALFLGGCVVSSLICIGNALINVVGSDRLMDVVSFSFTYAALTDGVGIPPAYFGIFCSFGVLIALESPFLINKGKLALALYLGTFILLISSIVSNLALLIILVLWLRARKGEATYKVVPLYVLAIALFSCVVYDFSSHSRTVERDEIQGEMVNSIAARLAIWLFASEAATAAPITGYGPALGQAALDATYIKEGFSWGAKHSFNAHNQFLSTYLDLGIMGICLLIGLLVHSMIIALRSRDLLLLGFVILTIVLFCFESALIRQKGIVFFSFFYSLFFSTISRDEKA